MAHDTSNLSVPPDPDWDATMMDALKDDAALTLAQEQRPCSGVDYEFKNRILTPMCGNEHLQQILKAGLDTYKEPAVPRDSREEHMSLVS